MKSRARINPPKRVWPSETEFTGRVTARVPLRIRDRLRYYAELTNQTTTACVVTAIQEYLQKRGY